MSSLQNVTGYGVSLLTGKPGGKLMIIQGREIKRKAAYSQVSNSTATLPVGGCVAPPKL